MKVYRKNFIISYIIMIFVTILFIYNFLPHLTKSIYKSILELDIYIAVFTTTIVLFFLANSIYHFFRFFDNRPMIVISEHGLLVRDISPDIIPWNYIEAAQHKIFIVLPLIEIRIAAAWSSRMKLRILYSVLGSFGKEFGLSHYYFSVYMLSVGGDRILSAIKQQIEASKDKPDSPDIDQFPPS